MKSLKAPVCDLFNRTLFLSLSFDSVLGTNRNLSSSREWVKGQLEFVFRFDFDRMLQSLFDRIQTPLTSPLHWQQSSLTLSSCRYLVVHKPAALTAVELDTVHLQVGIYFFPPTALVNTTQPLRRREADLVLCTSDLNVLIRSWCPEPVYSYTWQPFAVCLNYFQRNCL